MSKSENKIKPKTLEELSEAFIKEMDIPHLDGTIGLAMWRAANWARDNPEKEL